MKGRFFKPYCKCEGKCKCGSTWSYVVDVGTDPKTGKRKQKKKGGFKTQKEAKEALLKLLNELQLGNFIEESGITFGEFAYEWLSIYESSGKVKESTILVRKHEIKRLLDYFAKLKLKDITRKSFQDAFNDLVKRGFAQSTVDGIYVTGRMIFKKAVELEILKKDPTEYTAVPRKQKTVEEIEGKVEIPNYLEKDELKLFLNTAKTKGLELDYPIFLTLAYTGVRAGELCALKWRDIDFGEQTISITKTYHSPKHNTKEYKLLPPKTKNSIRVIDIDETLLNELNELRFKQKKVKMKHRDIYHDEDFVFANLKKYYGYPIYLKKVENRMRRLLKLSGLNEQLTPHSLRHTHTSLLAQIGVSLPQIMDRLGHKDENTTKNVYLHVTKDMKKEASQKFSKLMQGL